MKSITAEEIQLFAKLIFDVSGLHLDKDKGYLLETRLGPVLSSHGYATFSQLYAQTKADNSGKLQHEIVEAMTTNETFFFRDNTPFDLLRNKIIPDLIDRRSRVFQTSKIPLRIWSAACSSGQEVYSITMTLMEMLGDLAKYDIHILGTDISDKIIAQASYGRYNQFEIERGLPLHYRRKYFSQIGQDWRIRDEIRGLAQFKTMNLMKPFADLGGKFDLIFCRNVAIYFNQADKVRLFQKIARVLQPDGALLIGGSETLSGVAHDFESRNYLKGIFYQLSGQSAAAAPRPAPPSPTPALQPSPPVRAPRKSPVPVAMATGPKGPEARPPGQTETKDNVHVAKNDTKQSQPADVELETPAPTEPAPSAPNSQPTSPAKTKKSLLAAIYSSGKGPAPSLLAIRKSPMKPSLLDQLNKKKKKTNE